MPHQIIDPAPDRVDIPLTDLTGRPDADETARALADEVATGAFDLAAGPLLRARLIRLAPTEHLLVLCIHHIATDGWSTAMLVGELTAGYAAAVAGTTTELPELPVQYADFASWEREKASAEATDRLLAYWRERLADLPTLDLPPTGRARPSRASAAPPPSCACPTGCAPGSANWPAPSGRRCSACCWPPSTPC